MTDLVQMRADATEARKRVDSLLDINGELSLSQAEELETADTEYRTLKEQIKIAEIRESANESRNLPSFEFKGEAKQEDRQEVEPVATRSFEAMCDDAGARLLRKLGHNVEVRTADPYDTTDSAALVPVDLKNELIRRLPKMSGAMAASTVVTDDHDNEIACVVNRIPTVGITAEGSAFTVAQATFDRIRFKAYRMALETQITLEMLQDNRPQAMAETLLQHVESYAEGWDAAYLATMNPAEGSRTGPGGLCATKAHIDAAGATAINDTVMGTGDLAVADITIQDLLDVQAAVPGRYRTGSKAWVFSPDVHARIVQSIDANDRMIFFPQSTGTLQEDPLSVGTLLGSPIYLSDAMPSPGASAVAALYLDKRSYRVSLRRTLQTQEDPYTNGGSGIVAYRSHMRADGQWTLAEASSRLVYAAS
jgi:HK97 family phage major capsid protein